VTEEILFEEVAPVIPVRNLDAALDRYRRLGFAVRPSDGTEGYGFADRGSVTLHLSESAAHDPDRAGAVVYLYVSDADALHAEWAAAGVEGGLGKPRDTNSGLREFAFVDPDGTLHRVGSRLPH
jgi:catechol 2,3-dioxygenase-like lactoylglutathione lyase family enzyme